MQLINNVSSIKGMAHKRAGKKSHATRFQYEYIRHRDRKSVV